MDDKNKRTSENGPIKEKVEAKYKEIIGIMQDAVTKLENIKGINSEFSDYQKQLVETLRTGIQNVQRESQNSLNNIPWDKLVIAFFGETNAGKSTIIETFRILFEEDKNRNEDGLIVGDGQRDFTKEYHSYDMSINNAPFTLIDVPGIEGDESDFKEIIKEALNKAHCVFYVHGQSTKPDSATAEKIKKYLGNWVNVYSIQNVRGGADNYDKEEDRQTLLTEIVRKNELLIEDVFKNILGSEVYIGNIPVQALLAMCAKANFPTSRQRFCKTQKKLIDYFGNPDKIFEFSLFDILINTVKDLSCNITKEIAESNKQKLIALAKRTKMSLKDFLQEKSNNINVYSEKLKGLKEFAKTLLESTEENLNIKIKNTIYYDFDILEQSIAYTIDNQKKKKIKAGIDQKTQDFEVKLQSDVILCIKNELKLMKEKFDQKKNSLDGISLNANISTDWNLNNKMNVDSAIEELYINLDDIGDVALDIAKMSSICAGIGCLWGPLGAGFGAGIGVLLGAITSFFKKHRGHHGRDEVKHLISEQINDSRDKLMDSDFFINMTNSINLKLDDQKRIITNKIESEIKNLSIILENLSDIKKQIDEYIDNLNYTNYGTI